MQPYFRLLPSGGPLLQPVHGCLIHPYARSLEFIYLLLSQPSRKRKSFHAVEVPDDNDGPPRKKHLHSVEGQYGTADNAHKMHAQEFGNDVAPGLQDEGAGGEPHHDMQVGESACSAHSPPLDAAEPHYYVQDAGDIDGDLQSDVVAADHDYKVQDVGDCDCNSLDSQLDRAHGSIHHLPVELIRAIGGFADTETLYNLTCVCHFISESITPLYLTAQGFNTPRISSHPVTTISISTISQIMALQVWRRSSIFAVATLAFVYLTTEEAEARVQARCLQAAFSSAASPFARKLFIRLEGNTTENLMVLHSIKEFESVHIFTRDVYQDVPPLQLSTIGGFIHSESAIPALRFQNLEIRTPLLFTTIYMPWVSQVLGSPYLHAVDLQKLVLLPFQWTNLLHGLQIPSIKHFSITADAPLRSITAFLDRHRTVRVLFIGETEKQSRLRSTTAVHQLHLPNLEELHAPLHLLHPLLDIIRSPKLSTLSIFPSPDGLCPHTLSRLLVHRACTQVVKLEVRLRDALSTFIILSAAQVPMLPRIRHLTLTHGLVEFEFTQEALENIGVCVLLFSSLSNLHIVDHSYTNQSAIVARFAQALRVARDAPDLIILYNFENY